MENGMTTTETTTSLVPIADIDFAPTLPDIVRRPDVVTLMDRVKKRFNVHDMDQMVDRLRNYRVPLNYVLLLLHLKSEFYEGTKILKSDKTQDEDLYQGKVGLVVGLGPHAFRGTERFDFGGVIPTIGDWIVFKMSDCTKMAIDKAHCILIEDFLFKGIVPDPDSIDSAY